MRNIDLTGKTAIVTGGGQGIGLATATSLFDAGCQCHPQLLSRWPTATTLKLLKPHATLLVTGALHFPPMSVPPSNFPAWCSDITARFGGIDILVNNAGILRDREF